YQHLRVAFRVAQRFGHLGGERARAVSGRHVGDQRRLQALAEVDRRRQRVDRRGVGAAGLRREGLARLVRHDGGAPDGVRAGGALDQADQAEVRRGAVAGVGPVRELGHARAPPARAQRERALVDEEADQRRIALRRPQRQAAALVRDQVVVFFLQLVADVGDQARLVEVIGAQHQAEIAAAARVLREGDGEAGDLLHGIEAGAALEFGERVLVGLRFDRQLLNLGGGRAGAQLAHVDADYHARGRRKRRQAPLDGQRGVTAARAAPAAAAARGYGDEPGDDYSAADVL